MHAVLIKGAIIVDCMVLTIAVKPTTLSFCTLHVSSVVDYCPLAKLTVEDINTVAVDNLECSISNEDSALSDTEWAVAMAREKHGFLVTLLESVSKQRTSYIFIVKSK